MRPPARLPLPLLGAILGLAPAAVTAQDPAPGTPVIAAPRPPANSPSPVPIRPDPQIALPASCPDPAVLDLTARLAGPRAATRGNVEIVGRVRNMGAAAFVSDPRRQSLELVEETPGAAPHVVESATFATLVPNATTRIVHRRAWNTSVEFPPRFRLRIVYEPDIRADENPRNDDCGLGNNEAVLEPARIDALFR